MVIECMILATITLVHPLVLSFWQNPRDESLSTEHFHNDVDLSTDALTLHETLDSPVYKNLFLGHLQKEFSVENLYVFVHTHIYWPNF